MLCCCTYRAPELLLGQNVDDDAVDMWAVGCIFAEMVLGEPLFQGRDELSQLGKICEVMGRITKEQWPTVEELPNAKLDRVRQVICNPKYKQNTLKNRIMFKISGQGVDLLSRMLAWDPKQRISALYACSRCIFVACRCC